MTNLWIAKGVMLVAIIMTLVIRAPHGRRSRAIRIAKDRKSRWDVILLLLTIIGFWMPLIWISSSVFSFADYTLRLGSLVAGVACYVFGLALFHRSHADLGTNWSVTLQVRENHRLIIRGVYRRVRHPMYAALFLYSVGQALVVPNWIAGPSYLIALAILVSYRVGVEERMMLEEFGDDYAAYVTTTNRFVPGLW
jgi:protein-S-isoprenylcysteine O-methyltransferase Ste14